MKTGLVLIDIQNDYFPGGNMELVGIEKAATNAQKILQRFRDQKDPIFHIQHISMHPQATFMLPNTKGVQINEKVVAKPGEPIIEKHFPNSFRDTSLLNQLKDENIEELVICGAMSHMCIDTSVRAAFDLGFSCTVIEDACATRDLEYKGEVIEASKVHAAFMSALSLPFAEVVSTETYLK
jgi:nicotinamidase-related amidase